MLHKIKVGKFPVREEADDFLLLRIDQNFIFAFYEQRFRFGKTAVLLQRKRLLH